MDYSKKFLAIMSLTLLGSFASCIQSARTDTTGNLASEDILPVLMARYAGQETTEVQKALHDLAQKRKKAQEKSLVTVQKLIQMMSDCDGKNHALSNDVGAIAKDLSRVENVTDIKKIHRSIKEVRSKAEAAYTSSRDFAQTDELVTTLRSLEEVLTEHERLDTQAAQICYDFLKRHDARECEIHLDDVPGDAFFSSRVKPVLCFLGGAGLFALLHWRGLITVPQVQ